MDRYQAAEEIEANLRAGAVGEYLGGDDALEVLGEIFRLHGMRAEPGEGLAEHLRRVDTAVGTYIASKFEKIVADNVEAVMEDAA